MGNKLKKKLIKYNINDEINLFKILKKYLAKIINFENLKIIK